MPNPDTVLIGLDESGVIKAQADPHKTKQQNNVTFQSANIELKVKFDSTSPFGSECTELTLNSDNSYTATRQATELGDGHYYRVHKPPTNPNPEDIHPKVVVAPRTEPIKKKEHPGQDDKHGDKC